MMVGHKKQVFCPSINMLKGKKKSAGVHQKVAKLDFESTILALFDKRSLLVGLF